MPHLQNLEEEESPRRGSVGLELLTPADIHLVSPINMANCKLLKGAEMGLKYSNIHSTHSK